MRRQPARGVRRQTPRTAGEIYQGGRVCQNKLVRADYVDQVVWNHVTALLADPALIRAEIDKGLQRARTCDPATRKHGQLERALAKSP